MSELRKKMKDEMFSTLIFIVEKIKVIDQNIARLNGDIGIPNEILVRETKKRIDKIINEWFI